ncbi:hypothetical protein BGZ83_003514, partial [Gryganskiella cystojenkinii]
GLLAFQKKCVKQLSEIDKAINAWRSSGEDQDRSHWGVSARKPVFEVLWRLAGGSRVLWSDNKEGR